MKRILSLCCCAVLLGSFLTGDARAAELAVKKGLTLAVAKALAAESAAFAEKNNWKVVIAVVDDGGHLIYFERMDDVQRGSINVAISKARTAALYKRPTKAFEDLIKGGRPELLGIPEVMAIEGGVPIEHEGAVIGAIGVSGGTPQQDGMISKAGTDALAGILAR